MIIKLDKFFVSELIKNGVNLTYSELAEIYSESRKDVGCVRRAKDNAFINSIGVSGNATTSLKSSGKKSNSKVQKKKT